MYKNVKKWKMPTENLQVGGMPLTAGANGGSRTGRFSLDHRQEGLSL
jgi:hypothetical protein